MNKRRDDLFIELRRAWQKNYASRTADRRLILKQAQVQQNLREKNKKKNAESIGIFMDTRGAASVDQFPDVRQSHADSLGLNSVGSAGMLWWYGSLAISVL